MEDTSPTTITVPKFVRRALDAYRQGSRTYADVLLEFMEEWPSERFLREMSRRDREEPTITLAELRRRPGYYA